MNDINIKKRDNFLYLVLLLSVSFLYVSTYIYLAMGITTLVFAIVLFGKNGKVKLPGLAVTFILLFFYILLGLAFGNELSQSVTEALRLFIYVMVLILLYNTGIDEKVYDTAWKAMFLLCVVIQVVQFFKLFDINSVLIRWYPDFRNSADYRLTNYSSLSSFRSGSLFLSCNNYFKIVCISNAMALNNIYRGKKQAREFVYLLLTYVSALFTGSRTCFAILGVFLIIYIIYSMKNKSVRINWMFIPVVVLLALSLFGDRIMMFATGTRFFQLSQTGSLDYKFRMIGDILQESNTLQLLFGRGPYTTANSDAQYFMDSDLGYMIAYYGVVMGVVFITSIVFKMLKFVFNKSKENHKLQNLLIITMVVMSAITSGVIFNYRIWCLVLLALVPCTYSNDEFIEEKNRG